MFALFNNPETYLYYGTHMGVWTHMILSITCQLNLMFENIWKKVINISSTDWINSISQEIKKIKKYSDTMFGFKNNRNYHWSMLIKISIRKFRYNTWLSRLME